MFKSVSKSVSTGQCPYCSQQAFKYVQNDGKQMFLCHHCQRNLPIEKVKNGIFSRKSSASSSHNAIHINFNSLLRLCVLVSDLPDNHPCVQYVRSRGIDSSSYSRLFYTENFSKLAETAGKFAEGDKRLILPFFTEGGDLFALQGRSLDNEGQRYITLVYDGNESRLFGRDKVDTNKPFICVEGPIDSLFVNDCVAMAGSNGLDDKYKELATICLDNEPRNAQIVQKMRKFLDNGNKVVIWPDKVKEKDINDMVLNGIDVNTIIHDNTYYGLAGKITLENWKKVNG